MILTLLGFASYRIDTVLWKKRDSRLWIHIAWWIIHMYRDWNNHVLWEWELFARPGFTEKTVSLCAWGDRVIVAECMQVVSTTALLLSLRHFLLWQLLSELISGGEGLAIQALRGSKFPWQMAFRDHLSWKHKRFWQPSLSQGLTLPVFKSRSLFLTPSLALAPWLKVQHQLFCAMVQLPSLYTTVPVCTCNYATARAAKIACVYTHGLFFFFFHLGALHSVRNCSCMEAVPQKWRIWMHN